MARRSRSSEVELNLDGLTDVVTNLVGAIILLIVLVLGITRSISDASSKTSTPPVQETDPASRQSGRNSLRSLTRRVETLRRNIAATEVATRECESTMMDLQRAFQDRIGRNSAGAEQVNDKD